MTLPQPLPSSVHVAIQDLCVLVESNASLKNGIAWPNVAALASKLGGNAEVVLTPDEIQLAVDIAEMVVKTLMQGNRLVTTEVLIRICERVVTPITDALGYPGT